MTMEKLDPLKQITNIKTGEDKISQIELDKIVKPEYATFADLDKIDVRVCRVISAVDILKNPKKEPGEDNPVMAYHLVIDTGTEERNAVTNVVDKFKKEDLIGKDIPFVLNLEPRVVRGVLSSGMIVLAGDNLLLGGKPGDKVL